MVPSSEVEWLTLAWQQRSQTDGRSQHCLTVSAVVGTSLLCVDKHSHHPRPVHATSDMGGGIPVHKLSFSCLWTCKYTNIDTLCGLHTHTHRERERGRDGYHLFVRTCWVRWNCVGRTGNAVRCDSSPSLKVYERQTVMLSALTFRSRKECKQDYPYFTE